MSEDNTPFPVATKDAPAAPALNLKKPTLSFASEVKRIELEGGTWVEYKMLPYQEYMEFISKINDSKEDKTVLIRGQLELLEKCLTSWSDKEVECNPENIRNLGTEVIVYLSNAIMMTLSPEKKS